VYGYKEDARTGFAEEGVSVFQDAVATATADFIYAAHCESEYRVALLAIGYGLTCGGGCFVWSG
jgi:hypothetical protein